jgi:UDP-N-acetylmuramoyl-L-alanyl-D-glutamate--2,6-diaminopimelate ligase
MEEVENNEGFKVFIDYAHTPDALENVLTTLRKIVKE